MSDHEMFVLKGIGAVIGLVLLLWHMATTHGEMSWARGLRYVALAAAAGAVAFASQEQVQQHAVWEPRQWGGVAVVVTVIGAAIASILEDRGTTLRRSTRKRTRHAQDC